MEKIIFIVLATINPHEKEALQHYMEQMSVLYGQVEAISLQKHTLKESTIGQGEFQLLLMVEFPSQKAWDDVFLSEAYKDLLPYREKAFTKLEGYFSQ
ncbi:MAG: DUF1330 domain-containing protein [Bacteroidota bacterium]